jgi:hypothetical protein
VNGFFASRIEPGSGLVAVSLMVFFIQMQVWLAVKDRPGSLDACGRKRIDYTSLRVSCPG